MSGGEWPEDPSDPRCPSCGEPVSATAAYCMHCEADLPAENFEPAEATASPADVAVEEMTEADPGMPTGDEAAAGAEQTAEPASTGAAAGETAGPSGGEDEGALLDPDSLLDDVSTVMVALVAAPVAAVLAGLVTFWLLPKGFGSAAFWLGVAVLAGGGLWVARSRSVFDAARKAGYVIGGLLALVPPSVSFALNWQTPSDAVGGVFVFGIFLWPVALVVAGVGWLLGKGGVDDEG